MKNLITLSILSLIYSCVPTKVVEPAASSGNINSSAPYEWSLTAFPRNLKVSRDFSAEEVQNIEDMTNSWEDSLDDQKNFFDATEETDEVSALNLDLESLGDDDINGIYKITHWPSSLSTMALAVTQIFGRRFNIGKDNEYVRIEHADILINEQFYNFRTSNSGPTGSFDFQTVVLHELGHFIGLTHSSGNSVMTVSVGPDTTNRAPTTLDIGNVADKYGLTTPLRANGLSAPKKTYSPENGDTGQMVKILIELRADGECIHKENGEITHRHSAKIN